MGALCRLLDCGADSGRVVDDTGEVGVLGTMRCGLVVVLAVARGMDTVEVEGEGTYEVGCFGAVPTTGGTSQTRVVSGG